MGSRAYPFRVAFVLAVTVAAGCATTSGGGAGGGRGGGPASARGIAARIVLHDGTPVAGHALSLICDGHARTVRTDASGKLSVPDANGCDLVLPWMGGKRTFALRRETLYGTSGELRLPPVHRVRLRFYRGKDAAGTVVVDERVPGLGTIRDGALEINSLRFELSKVQKGAKLAAGAALIGVAAAPSWPPPVAVKDKVAAKALRKAEAAFAALRKLTRAAVPKDKALQARIKAVMAAGDAAVARFKVAQEKAARAALLRIAMVQAEVAWWSWRALETLPEGRDGEPTPQANALARRWTSRLTLASSAYRDARGRGTAVAADPTLKVRRMVPRSYQVLSVEKLSWLPLTMREDPSTDAAAAAMVRVIDPGREGVSFAHKDKSKAVRKPVRVVALRKLLGKRTLLTVGPCKERGRMVRALDAMVLERARNMGLTTHALFVDNCNVTGRPPRGGSRLIAGAEMLWALGLDPKKLEVPLLLALDERGRVGYRAALSVDALSEALTALAKGWAVLAAAMSGAGNAARAAALLSRAVKAHAGGKLDEARQLVEKAISADDKSAEAHRLRARVAAELGDLSTASQDVSWWRQSFGDLSADELEDELKKLRRKKRR
ncbi:MAG: hypothetical protein KC503_03740 [Myxococcales bacterium]|nr:hypothetical protein [Myxococcales bacterium]